MTDKDLEKARRLARTIIADLFLYNGDKIDRAIMDDNLFESLGDEIKDSENYYNSNVSPEIRKSSNYFWDVLFEKIMKREAGLVNY